MKSFGQKSWMLPQPVLIIGTYDKEGKPNAMNAAWGGQWDAKEIMIAMGSHATTENLNLNPDFTVAFATQETLVASDFVGIVSQKNEPNKIAKTGWHVEKAEHDDLGMPDQGKDRRDPGGILPCCRDREYPRGRAVPRRGWQARCRKNETDHV